jgi:methyl-accepting chemotaxis protein
MRSLKARLYVLLSVALAALLFVGGMGVYNASKQAHFGDEANRITEVLRAQMQADMMHDAIRGDVLNAMRVAADPTTSAEDKAALGAELLEHEKEFKDSIQDVAKHQIPAVDAQLAGLQKDLDAYIASANSALAAALRSKAEADAAWPAFSDQFKQLEDSMGKFGDTIEGLSDSTTEQSHAAAQQGLYMNWTVIGLSSVLLLAFGVQLVNRVLRQLGGDPQDAMQLAADVTQGNFQSRIVVNDKDNTSLMASMQALSGRIKEVIQGQ